MKLVREDRLRTSLAAQAASAFEKFAEGARAQRNSSIFEVWSGVFGGSVSQVLGAIADLAVSLDRIADQVVQSDMREAGKGVVLSAVATLGNVVSPMIQHGNAYGHIHFVDANMIGQLTVVDYMLQRHAPEASVPKSDLETIERELNDLLPLIRDAQIEPRLRDLLLRHAGVMQFALNNIELLGVQAVYDALGQAMITAMRLPDNVPAPTNTAEAAPRSLKEKVAGFIRGSLFAVESAEKMVKVADRAVAVADGVDRLLTASPA
jgi:hypothetical protein